MKMVFFDSSAILTWYKRQTNFEIVDDYLQQAAEEKIVGKICEINLVEILYQIGRHESDFSLAEEFVSDLLTHTGLAQVESDWAILRKAAKYKMNGNIALPDCILLATAKEQKAGILTSDPEFEPYQQEAKIIWI